MWTDDASCVATGGVEAKGSKRPWKAIKLRTPAGLDRLELTDVTDPGTPGAGCIRVRLHASSLNYHDYAVAVGAIPTADGRILMSDGAGVVKFVGEGVTEFAVVGRGRLLFLPSVAGWSAPAWQLRACTGRWPGRVRARNRR